MCIRDRREGDAYEFKIETRPHMDIRRELSEKMMENSWNIILMKYNELSLEEIFLQLTDSRKPKIKPKKDVESNAAAVQMCIRDRSLLKKPSAILPR